MTYTYGDSSWGDLLTAYDGSAITYDAIGNPLSDGTWNYTWEHGRQLAGMSNGSTTWDYTYDANGLRTSRSNGATTYTYVYDGTQLSQLDGAGKHLRFTYDANGLPMTVYYNDTTYYYVLNAQGDVTAILNRKGEAIVQYTYDAWGNTLSVTGSWANSLGKYNPLRYRGYVYDHETGLYYLQSRYYNPKVGRFLNADNYPTTGQGLTGNNMFAYCGNNPVSRKDDGGEFWNFVAGAIVGAVVGAVTTAVDAYKEDGWGAFLSGKTWAKIGVSAVCGAVNGTVAASGASFIIGGAVGGVTGFVESLSHELIDNDGVMTTESWTTVGKNTLVGIAGGVAGGNGAIHGNKYMGNQISRLVSHTKTQGLKKAGHFSCKMTATYSKQFVAPTIWGIAKGWGGAQGAKKLIA